MRRFLQFRLRTALIAMTLCGVVLGWFGSHVRAYQDEQAALAGLGKASVHFESATLLKPPLPILT